MSKIKHIFINIVTFLLVFAGLSFGLTAQNQSIKYKKSYLDDLVLKIEYRLFKCEQLNDVPVLCDSIINYSRKNNDIYLKSYGLYLKGAAFTELKNYVEASKCFNQFNIINNSEYLQNFRNYYIGVIDYRKNEFNKSMSNLRLAEKYFISDTAKLKNKIILALIFKYKGRIYAESGVYSQAIEIYYKSIKLFNTTPFKSNIYEVYRLIGRAYFMNSQFDPELKKDAMINYQKALSGFKQYHITQELSWVYTLLADYYSKNNDGKKAKLYQDSCMYMAQNNNQLDLIGLSYNNYGEINLLELKYGEAIRNFKLALDYYLQANNISNRIVTLQNLTSAYLKTNMADSAEKAANLSLVHALKFGNFDKIAKSYFCLSEIDYLRNNFKAAYLHHQKFKIYKDSVYQKQNMNIAYTMREIYETESKIKDNLILKGENIKKEFRIKSANRFTIIISILSSILILGGIFSFYNMKRRKEMQLQMETHQLLAEKFDIKEKTLSGTERELHSITNEIISVAKSIRSKDSKTNLASEVEILETIDEKMRNIQAQLKSPDELAQYRIKLEAFLFQHKNVFAFDVIKDIDPKIVWENVSMDIQMHLYRITQLLLYNTNIHAKAGEAAINCNLAGNRLHFMYTDDGIGYNPVNAPKDRGLAEIYSRLRYLRGTFFDESKETLGCLITIEIPLG